MRRYAALLRAINVGGTGKLTMVELRGLAEGCGFSQVATYIQSGNLVFESQLSAKGVKNQLERALAAKLGKPHPVLVRSLAELSDVAQSNPFVGANPRGLLIYFFQAAPNPKEFIDLRGAGREEWKLRGKELYVHYPEGQGRSQLKVPMQAAATARNLNTVSKLIGMLEALER